VLLAPDCDIYDAISQGLALATGDFAGFLNGYDLYSSRGSVAAMSAAVAAGGTDVDAVYGEMVYARQVDTHDVVRKWRSGPFAPAACVEAACHPPLVLRTAQSAGPRRRLRNRPVHRG
jgi:hypothetical protein